MTTDDLSANTSGASSSETESTPVAGEAVAITARAKNPNDPPLIEKLVDELNRELPSTISTGHRWLKGKAEESYGQAYLLKAQALAEIGRVELEERKRIDAREQAEAEFDLKREDSRMSHDEHRYELQTARIVALAGVASAIEKLQALGMTAEVEAISRALLPPPKPESVPPTVSPAELRNLGAVHLVELPNSSSIEGTFDEIVQRMRDLRDPATPIDQFMAIEARRHYGATGAYLPTRNAEDFIRGSERAGLLRILE